MLLHRYRRRLRAYLQLGITLQSWFALLFYPVSFLLLVEKVSLSIHDLYPLQPWPLSEPSVLLQLQRLEYSSSFARGLHAGAFVVLALADLLRYRLGTLGNLQQNVFYLTGFLFLSLCPVAPALVYANLVAEHRLPFDTAVGCVFLVLLTSEVALGTLVLKELLRQEAARFLRLCDDEDDKSMSPRKPEAGVPSRAASL